jgi:hypothetical protein
MGGVGTPAIDSAGRNPLAWRETPPAMNCIPSRLACRFALGALLLPGIAALAPAQAPSDPPPATALETMRQTFIDYLKYFEAIEDNLAPGALVVADNVIRSADAMRDFLDRVTKSPKYHTVILRASNEKNDGMAIIYKIR